jgi:Rrf2 family protein
MALLSRKVDYALLILTFLHNKPEGGCARAIADQLGLSRTFVANILKCLCNKGFVASERGKRGGYALDRAPDAISLANLIDALDEPFALAECCREFPDEGCRLFGLCPIQGPMAEAHRRVRGALAGVTLDQLIPRHEVTAEVPVKLEVSRCKGAC